MGYKAEQLVEKLRYMSEYREFDSHGVTGIFHKVNPFGLTMTLGSNQRLIEMSTRVIS